MVSLNFENIWTLMSKYTFEVDSEAKEEDFTCMICKKIMVDSYQSPCGCQYCHRCVLQYLGDERKCCPGNKKECKEEPLLLDENVCRIPVLNRKISKLRVHCPNKCCETIEELIKMEDHLRVCTKRAVECPYGVLGCDNKGGSKDKISTHINEDPIKHNQLLIEYIQNMKNELSNLGQITRNYEIMNREMNKLKEELKMTKSEVILLKEQSIINEMEIEKIKKDLIYANEKSKIKENEIEKLKRDVSDLKDKLETSNVENESLKEDGPMFIEKEKENMEEENERKINVLNTSNSNLNILSKSLNVDLVWRVDEISKKRNQDIFSEPFESNNYRLCLYLWVNNDILGGWIYLGGTIMKGEKDDEVKWPMRRALKVSLLDQDSLSSVGTVTLSYDTYTRDRRRFERPKTERNDRMYGYLNTRFYSLKDRSSVLVQDSLLISGVLSDH